MPDPIPVEVSIKRAVGGKLKLFVNARALHDELRAHGCTTEAYSARNAAGTAYETRERFLNQPESVSDIAYGNPLKLQPRIFLECAYPAEFDLSAVFTRPPTKQNLETLARSAVEVIKRITDHYSPVDVSIKIHKKASAG